MDNRHASGKTQNIVGAVAEITSCDPGFGSRRLYRYYASQFEETDDS